MCVCVCVCVCVMRFLLQNIFSLLFDDLSSTHIYLWMTIRQ